MFKHPPNRFSHNFKKKENISSVLFLIISKSGNTIETLANAFSLNLLKKNCILCTKCSLSKERTNVVFGRGNPKAKIFIIGEAPGQKEDEQGLAFVGRAGKMLD